MSYAEGMDDEELERRHRELPRERRAKVGTNLSIYVPKDDASQRVSKLIHVLAENLLEQQPERWKSDSALWLDALEIGILALSGLPMGDRLSQFARDPGECIPTHPEPDSEKEDMLLDNLSGWRSRLVTATRLLAAARRARAPSLYRMACLALADSELYRGDILGFMEELSNREAIPSNFLKGADWVGLFNVETERLQAQADALGEEMGWSHDRHVAFSTDEEA
ncbi:MAG: hypothetical protein H6739_41610 [Alphaproteobacteria bacterium]|nr:hypothetical protein [Alphaproteobacteria bacterium]